MQRIKLDAIDRRILHELQANGRITNVELSKRAKISAPPCLRRVRALEQAGFIRGYHADLDAVQPNFHDTPTLTSNTSLDFAELSPSFFVRAGNADAAPHIGISNDGGKTWYQGQEPSGVTGGDLARRATTQAVRFGTELLVGHSVVGLRREDPFRIVQLSNGISRSIIRNVVDLPQPDGPSST